MSEITNSSNDSSTDQKTVCTAGTSTNVDTNSLNSHSSEDVYLCVVPVRVRYDNAEVHTYAFLDLGSTHTFCDTKLINAINVSGESENISVNTLNGVTPHSGVKCSLSILPIKEDDEFILTDVISLDKIPVKPNILPAKGDIAELAYLRDIKSSSLKGGSVTLLIGANVPEMFIMKECRKGLRGQPIAVKTPLGWSLLGPSLSFSSSTNCQVNFVDSKVEEQIKSLWETNFQPETKMYEMQTSREDKMTLALLRNSVTLVHGHYQLPLPRNPGIKSPNNYVIAQKRLASLKARLQRDDSLKTAYSQTIDTYLKNGCARQVPSNDINEDPLTWYLPHHPRKPGKIRVVFDCAAKCVRLSLNHALMQGPDLVNNLLSVLVRFRQDSIALVADIEGMFHQIRVKPSHLNALRFLWWPSGNLNKTPQVFQMMVYIFGETSSPAYASFCLKQTAIDFGHLFDPKIAKIVQDNFYVDDCLASVSSVLEAKLVVRELVSLLKRGGFRLTKWLSNSTEVVEHIPLEERSSCLEGRLLADDTRSHILGILWAVASDKLLISADYPTSAPTSRRQLLSAISSIFDPLGLVAPTLLAPKVLQELVKKG